ncbi:MAG: hypothetical protein ACXAD7_02790 [Candidatus Kariarchaeaceae archaeon]|jgi:phosphomannomutase
MQATSLPLLFATSGIRGKANVFITPELAIRIGRAVGLWLTKIYPNEEKMHIYIGYDNRRNSLAIANCLAAAVNSSGVDVIVFDRPVPTPLVIHSTVTNLAHGGIMVTGSHLPADDNGVILFDRLGNYYKGILPEAHVEIVSWEKLGKTKKISSEIDDYISFISNISNELGIQKINYKIVLDPVHGPMKGYILHVLEPLVAEIVKFNWEDDDRFPGRNSEPTPQNIENTRLKVLETKSNLGIATDMDGDRVIFISKNGEIITGDYMGVILAEKIWNIYPDLPVVVPINTSAIINKMAQKYDRLFTYCRVGPPNIIEAIRANKAKLGFEETGKYIFSDYAIWPDSAITILVLLSLIQAKNLDLDQIIESMPKLTSVKTKVPLSRDHAPTIMERVPQYVQSKFENVQQIEDMDGIRINFVDQSWLLLRPSGTEDYLRIFAEHSIPEEAMKLNKKGEELVSELIQDLLTS